jgi:hypothetical protein
MKYSRVVRSGWVALFVATVTLSSVQGQAQLIWHATQRMPNVFPGSLGCWRNTCTACVSPVEDSTGLHLTFYRSDDAGSTWKPQTFFVPKDQLKPLPSGLYGRNVGIDQIDSAHAITVGNSGLILSTTDAGTTWSIDSCPVGSALGSISCPSFEQGIIAAYDPPAILIRVERSWQILPLKTSVRVESDSITWRHDDFWSSYMGGMQWCHAYGEGKYRVICQGPYSSTEKRTQMELYTTTDNWNSIDSTSIPFWSIDSGYHVDWDQNVCFGGGDTITVFGESWIPNRYIIHRVNETVDTICDHSYGILARTSDGGKRWERFIDTSDRHGSYSSTALTGSLVMSMVIDSTNIYPSHREVELLSHNSGYTWEMDSMRMDQASDSGAILLSAVETSSGATVGALYKYDYKTRSYSGILAKLVTPPASVSKIQELQEGNVYPNPATSVIYTSLSTAVAKVVDALGRTCDVRTTSTNAFDVSTLPPGVYYVTDEKQRARFVKQ